MFDMKTNLKSLAAAALIGAGTLVTAVPASAQTSLSAVLDAVRRDSNQLTQENEKRLREFRQATAEQEASMASLRAELRAAEAEGTRLQNQFAENQRLIDEKATELEAQAGDFGQLLGQFRQASQESMPVIRNSLASAEYKGIGDDGTPTTRSEDLSRIAQARTLPTRTDLDLLPRYILTEMIAQSEVKTFTAEVDQIGPNGETQEKEILRVGVFNAITTDDKRFVEMKDGKLSAYAKQPPGSFASDMAKLISAGDDEVIMAPLDPTKGDLFDTYGKLPTFNDRIEDGGVVGYVIITIGVIGVLLGLFKLVSIFLMSGAMRSTAKTKEAGDGNPLARVFKVYEEHRKGSVETLEMKIDEQILKESPKIERFNDILKVLASVAPLLGLLGTVIGMIITFTAITIYGAGDPQLMADGISTALMTTVMGLCAAIPLLLIHAVCAAASRSASQIIDEQAAGLIAERAEKEGVAA